MSAITHNGRALSFEQCLTIGPLIIRAVTAGQDLTTLRQLIDDVLSV